MKNNQPTAGSDFDSYTNIHTIQFQMLRLLHILLFLSFGLMKVHAQEQQPYQPYSKTRLEQAILKYEEIAGNDLWYTFPDTLLLRPGDSSRFVPQLQENLLLTGDLEAAATTDTLGYTAEITTAVRRFQRRHGLAADGVVGPNTISALNVPPGQRLEQMRINLSRFDSVFTNQQEPYAIINLPEFVLQVVDSGRTFLRMRVIVGKTTLKTYPIHSRLDMVVLNPYWYVPASIAVNEIVPILRRNPGYLAKKNMALETFTEQGWVRINPWEVNWQRINKSNYTYRIVQLSGPDNELGQVKFPFPNHLPQYLHDTPYKTLFKYPNRAFSHGCIRLEKPVELAYYLLKRGSGYTTERVDELWEEGVPNHYLRIKKPVPLHIVYFTSWVTEQMEVQFREDVYGYDALLDLTLQQ